MKKNIKKIIAIVAILVIGACVLAGCAKKNTTEAPSTTEGSTTEAVTEAKETSEATQKATEAETTEPTTEAFKYQHDPRKNASAMADIVENPDAVYGFSPNPESTRLGEYAKYSWTDPDAVESYKQERLKYHKSIEGLYTMLNELRAENKTVEEMARAISTERNRIRMDSYKDDPEGLATLKKSNLDTYGHEEGPLPDELYEKYGSWEKVLQKAFGTNAGMDACTGLYDEYYFLYVELGMVEEE